MDYEKERINRIKENNEIFKSLGIESLVSNIKHTTVQTSKEKGKDRENPEDEEYTPEEEGDVESEDSSEVHKNIFAYRFSFIYIFAMKLTNFHVPINCRESKPLRQRSLYRDPQPVHEPMQLLKLKWCRHNLPL